MTIKIFTKNKQFSQVSKRILLVEDHDVNRMLLSDFLTYQGYMVKSLKNGYSFLSKIFLFKPDIVLLDLKLPDIDGYYLLEQIRTHPHISKLPIIVVSAFAFKSDMEKAKKLGANYYLVKPIDLNNLVAAIEKETQTCKSQEMYCVF
ncbi:MAG: response regulator [Cyanobacteria bacterium P01_A01_bin.45]